MVLKARITKIHTEHCYVQNPVIVSNDYDLINRVHVYLQGLINASSLKSFYLNHFVMETIDGMFIGINDLKLTIGVKISSLEDSSIQECDFWLRERFDVR